MLHYLIDKFTKFRNCSVFNRKKYHPIIETIKIPMCVYEKGGEGGREGGTATLLPSEILA